jgi:hypothetical protein
MMMGFFGKLQNRFRIAPSDGRDMILETYSGFTGDAKTLKEDWKRKETTPRSHLPLFHVFPSSGFICSNLNQHMDKKIHTLSQFVPSSSLFLGQAFQSWLPRTKSYRRVSHTTFPFSVAESPKMGEAGGEVSEPKRTSRGRVKRVATLPASFASGAIPPTCTRIQA